MPVAIPEARSGDEFIARLATVDAGPCTFDVVGRDQFNLTLERHRWSNRDLAIDVTSPQGCADGWTEVIHPDGWRYFHSHGIVTDDLELAQKMPTDAIFERELYDNACEEYFSPVFNGKVLAKLYINHEAGYASKSRERVHCLDQPNIDVGQYCSTALGVSQYLNFFHISKVTELRIEYWTYIVKHPSHKDLHNWVEEAARQALHVFMMGEST